MPILPDELKTIAPSDCFIKFNDINRLFEMEETKVLKVANMLKKTALNPSNIQKVSPQYALCKFLLENFNLTEIINVPICMTI